MAEREGGNEPDPQALLSKIEELERVRQVAMVNICIYDVLFTVQVKERGVNREI